MAARRKGRTSWRTWGALLAVAVAVFAAGLYVGRWRQGEGLFGSREPAAERVDRQTVAYRVAEPAPPAAPAPLAAPEPVAEEVDGDGPPVAPEEAGPRRVALVIDDLGRSLAEVEAVTGLGIPVTCAVLPFEIRTTEVVADLNRRGVEILCHLPMEPAPGANPGPGALTRSMSRRKLGKATRAALDAVPGASGVNNHMGSVLTTDPRAMELVLRVLAKRGLFFLDSRTTADSLGYKTARRQGIPTAERQVFLDPELDPEAIAFQFTRLLEIARVNGTAIGIGHPHRVTVEVLTREIPKALAAGYEFVPVSYLLERDHSLER